MKRKRQWIWVPAKPKFQASVEIQKSLAQDSAILIDTVLKPRCLAAKPTIDSVEFIGIKTKWHQQRFFHFSAQFKDARPDRLSDFYDQPFARMEYKGDNLFDLAFMRHTGQWWNLHEACTTSVCLDSIRDDPWFAIYC